ncbi:MAG TPA: hypothetical protein VLG76_05975 [Rhabdochlamydiaceae bacterium]|nr:hypothetical protein [Rhabdochlamydiaceae bacterium]
MRRIARTNWFLFKIDGKKRSADQNGKDGEKVVEEARLKYPHSKFWLIFWLILFFPIGLVLLSQLELVSQAGIKKWEYRGERFWLYFWAILFFPIAFLLLLLNGVLVKSPRV